MFLFLIFRLEHLWLWNYYEIDWDDFANSYLLNKIVEMKRDDCDSILGEKYKYTNYF